MMTQDSEDLLDTILREIEPDHVPAEFVSAACVTSLEDEVYMITNEELEKIMMDEDTLEEQGIAEIGLILNLAEVKETIHHFCEIILKDIEL
jgi:hypothetical protein